MPEILSGEGINRLIENLHKDKQPQTENEKPPENKESETAPEQAAPSEPEEKKREFEEMPSAEEAKPESVAPGPDWAERARAVTEGVGRREIPSAVTGEMRALLGQIGLNDEAVDRMTPSQAFDIINLNLRTRFAEEKGVLAEGGGEPSEAEKTVQKIDDRHAARTEEPPAPPGKPQEQAAAKEEKPTAAAPPEAAEPSDKEKEKKLEKTPEMAEIKKEIDAMPREEKMGLMRGMASAGFYAQKGKSALFAAVLEKLGGKSESQKTMARFMSGLAETYRRDEKSADKKLDAARQGKIHGWGKLLHGGMSTGYVTGNLVKYGRLVGDIVGWTAAMPLRYAMMGSMFFARLSESAKEARFKNEELIDKTRIQDAKQAAAEAWAIHEQLEKEKDEAGTKAKEEVHKEISAEELEAEYKKRLPADLMARLNKNALTAKVGIASHIVRNVAEWNIERSAGKIQAKFDELDRDENLSKSQKAAAQKRIISKYERRLKDWDRAVTQYGTADALAMGARYAELAGKTAVLAMGAETVIYGAIHSIAELLGKSDLSRAAETTAAAHGAGVTLTGKTPAHEFIAAQADKLAQPAPTHFGPMPHEAVQRTAEAIPRGEAVPIPAPEIHADYSAVIPEHGNVWEAAKSIGLNQKAFADAWANPQSGIHTPEGFIHAPNVDLVHKGDIVNFIPGKNGGPGRIEIIPASGQHAGTGLPAEHIGRVEPKPLHEAPYRPIEKQGPWTINTEDNIRNAPGAHAAIENAASAHSAAAEAAHGAAAPQHAPQFTDAVHNPETVPTGPAHPETIPVHTQDAVGNVKFTYDSAGMPVKMDETINMLPAAANEYYPHDFAKLAADYAAAHHLDQKETVGQLSSAYHEIAARVNVYRTLARNPHHAKEAAFLFNAIKKTVNTLAKTYGPGFVDKAKLSEFLK